MNILITGIAGFVGGRIAAGLAARFADLEITGIDNLSRRGSETNLPLLENLGCRFVRGDIRSVEDVDALPRADWIIDCAAVPTVTAGLANDSAELVSNNLIGTLRILEKCRRDNAGLILISTSRVYSIEALGGLPLRKTATRFELDDWGHFAVGASPAGIGEEFSTRSPISLYGATKLASETMALEYASAYGFPLWINRCGLIAGAGQFGKIDQGVVSFWIYQWMLGRPLSYIGFGGDGAQTRDMLSPDDLIELIDRQLREPKRDAAKIINVGGGRACSISLRELSDFCAGRFNVQREIARVPDNRPFDIPLYITDNALLEKSWQWRPRISRETILNSIADWAEGHRALVEAGF